MRRPLPPLLGGLILVGVAVSTLVSVASGGVSGRQDSAAGKRCVEGSYPDATIPAHRILCGASVRFRVQGRTYRVGNGECTLTKGAIHVLIPHHQDPRRYDKDGNFGRDPTISLALSIGDSLNYGREAQYATHDGTYTEAGHSSSAAVRPHISADTPTVSFVSFWDVVITLRKQRTAGTFSATIRDPGIVRGPASGKIVGSFTC